MMRLKGMKRFLSVVLCAAILTGGVYSGTGVVKSVPVSAMTLAELQTEKQANADKIAKMQKELDDLGSDQQEPGRLPEDFGRKDFFAAVEFADRR